MKEELKKFWDFLWHSNSIWSWILNVILAFIIIKFALYPVIGLAFGTPLPVVAVISESMEHPLGDEWMTSRAHCLRGPCTQEAWYIDKGISSQQFSEFPFKSGFNKGDIMILVGKKPEKINVGDIIVFKPHEDTQSLNYPIIHRVIAIHEDKGTLTFETKGDNNPSQIKTLFVDETNIQPSEILGVAKVRLPYLGYIKIWVTELFGVLK